MICFGERTQNIFKVLTLNNLIYYQCFCSTIVHKKQVSFFTDRLKTTLITFEEKQVPFEIREVSLLKKEPFFTETYKKAFGHDPNSDGKVPILIDGDRVLTESDLISWYVAEKYEEGTKLVPSDPFDKLRVRWFFNTNSKLTSSFFQLRGFPNKSKEEQQKVKELLHKTFQDFENSLALPFAIGNQFTLADVLFIPWFNRWPAIAQITGVDIPERFTKLYQWIKNIGERESVKKVRQPIEYYLEGYKPFFA